MTTKEAELLRLLCMNANNALENAKMHYYPSGNDDSYFNGRSTDVFPICRENTWKERIPALGDCKHPWQKGLVFCG